MCYLNKKQKKGDTSSFIQINGFTLVELAIVLVIIGIILSIGFVALSVYVQNAKLQKNREIVKVACEALKGFAKSHRYLPPVSEFHTKIGVNTKDAFQSKLLYKPASGIDNSSADLCQQNGTWLKVRDRGIDKTDVAFIVYSKGKNYKDDSKCSQSPSPCDSSFSGDYQLRILDELTNSGNKYDDVACYMDINILRSEICPVFEITTSSLPVGTQYLPYPDTSITVANGKLSSCSISGNLPPNLTFDSNRCSISGTPKQAGTFNITITAKDTIGRTATKSFTLTINPNPVKITTTYLPYAYTGQDYSVGLSATGATGSYRWQLINNGGLSNLSLSSSGVLSISKNNLKKAGVYTIKVKVCDATYINECKQKTFNFTVLSSAANSNGGNSNNGNNEGGNNEGGNNNNENAPKYTVKVYVSAYYRNKGFPRSIKLPDIGCQSITRTRRIFTFKDVSGSTATIYQNYGCTGRSTTINFAKADKNNDKIVYIGCAEGSYPDCAVFDTQKSYCSYISYNASGGELYTSYSWNIVSGSNCSKHFVMRGRYKVKVVYKRCGLGYGACDFDPSGGISQDKDLDCKIALSNYSLGWYHPCGVSDR